MSHAKKQIICVRFFGHLTEYTLVIFGIKSSGGVTMIKGYFVSEGYMGYVDGEYQLFADERDYVEYIEN